MGIISSWMVKSDSGRVSWSGTLAGAPSREASALTSIKKWMRDDRNWAVFISVSYNIEGMIKSV